ncbi:MAG: prepilin peptidase, partial [bacterium]
MTLVGALGAFALGACLGSFANVCIDRLPRGLSPVRPRSSCEACGHLIRPVHLIPLVGYLLVRGRCASCGQSIPLRLPLVEALGGLLAA